MGEKGAT